MIIPFTNELIQEIVACNSAMETGVFISLICHEYIKQHNITEKQFFKSLKASLKKFKEVDNIEKD